jgi:hypothetical protein
MKEKLIAIFNTLQNIETHGNSTILMADCIRELAVVIDSIPNEEKNGTDTTD